MSSLPLSVRKRSPSKSGDALRGTASLGSSSLKNTNNAPVSVKGESAYVRVTILKNIKKLSYVHLLSLGWIALAWYGERRLPYKEIEKCHWHLWEQQGIISKSSKVALIADPQLVDDNTYPGRAKSLLAVTKYIVDIYLRRNWVYMNQILDPDANIFLGDLFDGGREWGDVEWRREFERWNSIFTRPHYKRTVMSLPGNHDIGFGDTIVSHAHGRFQAFFGPPSSTVEIGNYRFVLLDSISMTNTINESIFDPPMHFVNSFSSLPDDKPRILLTHVPLFRPADTDCGPYRESHRPLRYTGGYQYETMINNVLTDHILSTIKPVAVFSGDDHDACHVSHSYSVEHDGSISQRSTPEFTVKSFSMAMGINYPAIQLITLDNTGSLPAGEPSYHTEICYMPSPFYPFILYGLFAIISLVAIILYNFVPKFIPRRFRYLDRSQPVAVLTDPLLPVYSPKNSNDAWKMKKQLAQGNWKRALTEAGVIAFGALSFYLYLGWSIFH